jgi:Mrp family chromosome partitioning ATPase
MLTTQANLSSSVAPHEVITFYSYKGGTGRTMALANIACLFARQGTAGMRVLAIDWDLEAPGLHYYLRSPANVAVNLNSEGVVEYFSRALELVEGAARGDDDDDAHADQVLGQIPFKEYCRPCRPAVSIPLISVGLPSLIGKGFTKRRLLSFEDSRAS